MKADRRANRDINVELKSDDELLHALHQAVERAKSVLLVLGVPLSKDSFEFKHRVDSELKIKNPENDDDIEEQYIDETIQKNSFYAESSLAVNENEQIDSSMNDLAIVHKYCGKCIEKCSSNDGKCSDINRLSLQQYL